MGMIASELADGLNENESILELTEPVTVKQTAKQESKRRMVSLLCSNGDCSKHSMVDSKIANQLIKAGTKCGLCQSVMVLGAYIN